MVRSRLKRMVMAGLLALAPPAVLELALRAAGIGDSIVYKEDPRWGYRPAPSQRFSTLGKPVEILDNGCRGPVRTSDLMCVGDSVTYGTAAIGDSETFPAQLGAINAGVNGWGIPNVAAWLQHEPPAGQKTVVWTIPSCDALRPFTTLRKGLIGTNRPMLLRIEYLLRFVWFGMIRTQPDITDPVQYEPNFAAVLDTSRRLRERGVGLLLVFLPSKEEAMGRVASQTPFFRRMIEECRAAGLNVAEADPGPASEQYYRDSAHLTPDGNRWLAGVIRSALEEVKP